MNKQARISILGLFVIVLVLTFLYVGDIGQWFDELVEFGGYIGGLVYAGKPIYGLSILFCGLFVLLIIKNRYW